MKKNLKSKKSVKKAVKTVYKFECDACGERFEDAPTCESCGTVIEEDYEPLDGARCGCWKNKNVHFCSDECAASWFTGEAEIISIEEDE